MEVASLFSFGVVVVKNKNVFDKAYMPVYRYWNNKDHIYTCNPYEIPSVSESGYLAEGICFYLMNLQATKGCTFYRYYNNVDHFYTMSTDEIGTSKIGEVGKYSYRFEGPVGNIFPVRTFGSQPLFRYYNKSEHFYTTNKKEVQVLNLNGSKANRYNLEGVAGYVYPCCNPLLSILNITSLGLI